MESVASELAMLCADERGVARAGRQLHDEMIRVAVLVDLTFWGRLEVGTDGSTLDTTPTGFEPADTVLRYVDSHPSGAMFDVFRSADVGLLDAAVAALAGAVSLCTSHMRSALIDRCGPARQLMPDLCTYLSELTDRLGIIAALPFSARGE